MTDDAIDILKQSRKFIQGNTHTDYLLVYKQESGVKVERIEFPATIQQQFGEIARNAVTAMIDDLREGKLQETGLNALNTVTDKSTLQRASGDDLPETELAQVLTEQGEYRTGRYNPDSPPDFQLIRVTDNNKVFLGVQNHQSLRTYEPSQEGLTLFYDNEIYNKFEGELLMIPESLNAVYFDEEVFVRTPKSFESMFEMREEYEKQAEKVVSQFNEAGIGFSDDKIADEWLMGDIRVLRRMFEIQENGIPEYATPKKIKQIIDDYPINVDYEMDGDEISLSIDEYVDIWALLRLLNDNYAEAEIMPDTKLEIENKRIL